MHRLNTYKRVAELAKSSSIAKPGWFNAAELVPPQRKPFGVAKPKVVKNLPNRLCVHSASVVP